MSESDRGKDELFNMWYCLSRWKIIKMGSYFTLYTKINSKWIKVLNVKGKPIRLSEENVKETLMMNKKMAKAEYIEISNF